MWFWALVACLIFAAVFLVITLAQMEAGAKSKGKWLALTFCSIAVVTGLIILKPKPNMEQIQYMPAPSPVPEQVVEPKKTAQQKSDMKPSGSVSGLHGGERLQGATGENQGSQGIQGAGGGGSPVSVQWEFGGGEDRDPVLEEILQLKRQAEENKKEAVVKESPGESSIEKPGDSVSPVPAEQERNGLTEPEGQQLSDGLKEHQINDSGQEETQQQPQSQHVVRASVLEASLNVRDKAGMDGQIIGNLKTGDIIEVIDGSGTGEWIEVKLNSGQLGWVMKKYISLLP